MYLLLAACIGFFLMHCKALRVIQLLCIYSHDSVDKRYMSTVNSNL